MNDRAGMTAQRKAVVKARRREERLRQRDVRRIHRRCFWTWPWGHAWEWVRRNEGYGFHWIRCVGCGWEKQRWTD